MGFEKPILHGLASYGISCRGFLESYPGDEIERIGGRFVSPVVPGDELKVYFLKEGE